MIAKFLNDVLRQHAVHQNFKDVINDEYRQPLQDTINSGFNNNPKPLFRYGGSLAKGTANKDNCDIDLLAYLPNDCMLSVKNIYEKCEDILKNSKYDYEPKNNAIKIKGTHDEKWDITVDLVPGKYTTNDNKDVNLWCNKDNKMLKSNPEIHIRTVQSSKMKDVIRLIKILRKIKNFEFKSFFLEMFAIQIVEPELNENDNIYDKLIKFCAHYDDIGKIKIIDPANEFGNYIMDMHSEIEFNKIRKNIEELYNVLLTNDLTTIKLYFNNKYYSLEIAYKHDALKHTKHLNFSTETTTPIRITCKTQNSTLESGNPISKNEDITFYIFVPQQFNISDVKITICNAGYEAWINNCQRGNLEKTKKINKNLFSRKETTRYQGLHFVQAKVIGHKQTYYSKPFIVNIQ